MKRITKAVDLTGQHETITAMDLRRSPGDVLLQVELGKEFTITRNGVAVARLMRPETACTNIILAEIRKQARDA